MGGGEWIPRSENPDLGHPFLVVGFTFLGTGAAGQDPDKRRVVVPTLAR